MAYYSSYKNISFHQDYTYVTIVFDLCTDDEIINHIEKFHIFPVNETRFLDSHDLFVCLLAYQSRISFEVLEEPPSFHRSECLAIKKFSYGRRFILNPLAVVFCSLLQTK
jgi:hypothetical protein